jgi:hypothetical protein
MSVARSWIREASAISGSGDPPVDMDLTDVAVMAELKRCLHRLLALFPDPDFRANPPEIVLAPGYPVPEAPMERDACIPIYRRDLRGSPVEILTALLHKMIHAFHAFWWRHDCTCWSYHTRTFRRQAEQVGFDVSWAGRRYGWAQTRPGRSLEQLFEDIAFSAPICGTGWRPIWPCGSLRFPDRAELEGSGSRRLVRSLQVHRRGKSPMVRLSGRWLTAFGFAQGARLKVDARPGRLVLEARPEGKR